MSKQLMKTKRKVNRTKRAKIGSHGFKVYKNTYVYIAKSTDNKPAPRKQIVEALVNHFNTSQSIRKMVKHIKRVRILYSDSSRFAGTWWNVKQEFSYIDHKSMNIENALEVMIHEIDGHAFYQFGEKWRKVEWDAFNELANKMPPVNRYVKTYLKNKIDGRTNTKYENEQHSAITELMVHGSSYHTLLIGGADLEKLKNAWSEFHY